MPRVVIVGTGFGRRNVAPVFQALGWQTHIVSPHDPAALRAAIEAPCDLVSIHSPPFLHHAHVRLATAYGRHVLCDKPFGSNAAEAADMLALATEAGVLHFLNFEFRHDPLRRKLKDTLEAGTLGTPVHISMTAFITGTRQQTHRWLFDKDEGGGWIGAYGSHTVDLLRWLFGEIAETGGIARTDIAERPGRNDLAHTHRSTAEDAFTAWFRMENGVTAMLDTAFCAAIGFPATTTVLCSDGALHVTGRTLQIMRTGQPPESHALPHDAADPIGAALSAWLAQVSDAVEHPRQIGPDFTDGLACTRTLDTLRTRLRRA